MSKIKELHIDSKIAPHDLQTKIFWLERTLAKGCHVKVSVSQRGRMQEHGEIGVNILNKIKFALIGKAKLSGTPVLSGPTLSIFLVPA